MSTTPPGKVPAPASGHCAHDGQHVITKGQLVYVQPNSSLMFCCYRCFYDRYQNIGRWVSYINNPNYEWVNGE